MGRHVSRCQLAVGAGVGAGIRASRPLHEQLSQREYQVFRLLSQGRSVGEIAEQLALSSNTVSTYRARILEKTGVRNDVGFITQRERTLTVAVFTQGCSDPRWTVENAGCVAVARATQLLTEHFLEP